MTDCSYFTPTTDAVTSEKEKKKKAPSVAEAVPSLNKGPPRWGRCGSCLSFSGRVAVQRIFGYCEVALTEQSFEVCFKEAVLRAPRFHLNSFISSCLWRQRKQFVNWSVFHLLISSFTDPFPAPLLTFRQLVSLLLYLLFSYQTHWFSITFPLVS